MLVLSRKQGESIEIPSSEITVFVLRVEGNRVQLGWRAPDEVRIVRTEILEGIEPEPGQLAGAGQLDDAGHLAASRT